ncbi:hypothetical protein G6011_11607 [Alternaria panax]|uniref:Splicing factor YJU2 n=1 Tax=Alternaria panax TaxID=48097 RepID=A0AAD4IDW7_9PLEO|nr:hypothetical protein G6011_11607 [Alternaria panax]
MAKRKLPQKYYPAHFDPSKILHSKHPIHSVVNFVCPFRSMRCLACGRYTTKGKVFRNSPKHISPEIYLGVRIERLHCRCPGCAAEIVIETDPKNMDYRIVNGAMRGFEAWRDEERVKDTKEQRLDRLENEASGEGDEEATIETLERRTEEAKIEVAVADALDKIREFNTQGERVGARFNVGSRAKMRGAMDDERDTAIARAAFRGGKRGGILGGRKRSLPSDGLPMEAFGMEFSATRPVKKAKQNFANALGIRRKTDA